MDTYNSVVIARGRGDVRRWRRVWSYSDEKRLGVVNIQYSVQMMCCEIMYMKHV